MNINIIMGKSARSLRPYSGPLRPGEKRTYLMRKKKKPMSLAAKVKKIQLRNCETKFSCRMQDTYTAATQLFIQNNQTLMIANNLLGTTPGSNNPSGFNESTENRVGDEIIAKGIRFSVWVESVSDRQNTRFGVVCFKYNPQIATAGGGAAYALNSEISKVFWRGTDGDGGDMLRFIDQPNPEKVTVLKHIKLSNSSANYYENVGSTPPDRQNNTHCVNFYVPLKNLKVKYRRDTLAIPQWKDIGLALYAFNQSTALSSDNVGVFSVSSRLYFKDP